MFVERILEKPTAIGLTSKVGIARSLVVPRVGQVLIRIATSPISPFDWAVMFL